ncbi:hypothetical protein [Endozoicomonas sp. ALC020]|uniref:hypothetical protein n=1 Tax=unclassified Endozoicomonas TaxID=2644528 RepID=UPI003BAEBA24
MDYWPILLSCEGYLHFPSSDLPIRQLAKYIIGRWLAWDCDLPIRQLAKLRHASQVTLESDLPIRQLANRETQA